MSLTFYIEFGGSRPFVNHNGILQHTVFASFICISPSSKKEKFMVEIDQTPIKDILKKRFCFVSANYSLAAFAFNVWKMDQHIVRDTVEILVDLDRLPLEVKSWVKNLFEPSRNSIYWNNCGCLRIVQVKWFAYLDTILNSTDRNFITELVGAL